MTPRTREQGFPQGGPAPELIDSGFALENADASFLHRGLNLADIAHVLDLARRGIVPPEARNGAAGAAARGQRGRRRGLPVRPGERRAVQLARAATSSPASATSPAGCTPAGRGGRPPGSRCGCTCAASSPSSSAATAAFAAEATAPGRGARRDAAARPDLPAAGAALDVRALPALVRLPRGARRPPPARRARLGGLQPRRRRLRQRHPAAGGPRADRRRAGVPRRSSRTPATRCGRSTA